MSKKILIVPFIIILLLMCSCSSAKHIEPVVNNISFTALFKYDDTEFESNIEIADSIFTATVIKPEIIKNLVVTIKDGNLNAEYLGVKYSVDQNCISQTAPIHILYSILNAVATNDKAVCYTDENCVIKDKTNGYEFCMNVSPTGLPISVAISEPKLEILFENVTVK